MEAYTADSLKKDAKVDPKWSRMPGDDSIAKTVEALTKKGIDVIVVGSKGEALEKVKGLMPPGSEVMNGSSTTLIEIGYMDYLEGGKHGWKNKHEEIFKEDDPLKRADIRRKALTSQYFLGSVNAISETGELVAADFGGSRVGAYPSAAKNLILVSGVNKIVPSLDAALARLREYAYPLEDARMKKAFGTGSAIGKIVIIEREKVPHRTTLILVKESLGY